jgi:hypothetical protein
MEVTNVFKLIWMFGLPIVMVLVPIFMGQHYGNYLSKKTKDIQQSPVSTLVGTAFGLLAFIMAFTFQIAASRYDARKNLLLDEISNVRTTFHRTDLIPEPYHTKSKVLLSEYVNLRIGMAKGIYQVDYVISRSHIILVKLWDNASELAKSNQNPGINSLYITSVNNLMENYNRRNTIMFDYHIPNFVKWILMLIVVLSMFLLGYYFGISGTGFFRISLIFAIVFALVLFLISILDSVEIGFANINQQPWFTLQQQMH